MTPRRGEALSRKVSDQDHLSPTWLPLPVDADGTQVQDAGRAHHDIQSDEDVAVKPAELPLAHHLETKQCHGWEAGLWRVFTSGSLLGEVGGQSLSLYKSTTLVAVLATFLLSATKYLEKAI